MRVSPLTAVAVAALLTSSFACKKDDPPPQNPQGWQQPAPAYGQPGYGQPQPAYGQPPAQPGYPAAAPPAAPGYTTPAPTQPAYTPAPPPAAAPATGMNPNPAGFPCQNDTMCGTHKCNTTAGKCSFPCQGNGDCIAGMQCVAPICVPAGMPGTSPSQAK